MSRQIPSGKATANESKYPYIIELALTGRLLDVGLSCRIMNFHKTRHIQPRHGHTAILKEGRTFRWCFSDLETARGFHRAVWRKPTFCSQTNPGWARSQQSR